jgi:drug/metabolite transporter (DMT)-like permease
MFSLKGVALKILATLAVTLMFASIRALDGRLPTGEVVFFRSVFAFVPLVLWYGMQGRLASLVRTESVLRHFGRGISGLGGMYFNYLALSFLPLAQLTAFTYAVPIFTVIFAALLLREQVRIYRWSAVAFGFAGVFIMLIPALTDGVGQGSLTRTALLSGAAAALLAAASSALSFIQIRKMTANEDPAAIVFWFTALTTFAGLASALFGWEMPTVREWVFLFSCGLFGYLGQIFMVLALRHAHASLLAPFEYAGMIWAVAIGYWAFSTIPDAYTVIGSVIVASAGLFTILREHRLARNHTTSG